MNRFRLRRWWFQVHKWIGIGLAVLIVPLSLSGAALVWHGALDQALNPGRYAISGAGLLPIDAYVAAATPRLAPGERIAQVTLPADGGPVIVAAAGPDANARPGPPARFNLYLDPPTARVLDAAQSTAGPVRLLHVLHGSLLVPGWGRTIVGWVGVALLLTCVSGVWLWWPTTGRAVRGLRWRRRAELDANLHHLFGVWVALPLAVLAGTGVWISFPPVFAALVGEAGPRGPERPAQARARPAARTGLTADDAVARARKVVAGPVRTITWPTERKPDWSVRFAAASVSVADDEGVAVLAPERPGQGGVARLMRRVHVGEDTGPVWQVVIFAAGLAPAVLAVTGLLMWWRPRRRRTLAQRA